MEQPLISCVIPVFNGERYLREAVDSILAQTYRPLQIIVADDGSTDGTPAMAAGYDGQVRYLRQANAGPGAARNLGIDAARGEFIAFLDADDLWHPEKLARQFARFEARPELDLCVTHVKNFWAPELRKEEARLRNHRLARPLPGYIMQTVLARRALFQRVGKFAPELRHGDVKEWFLRAAEHGAVIELLPDVLVSRRLHKSNLSRLQTAASLDEHLQLVKASLDRRRTYGTVPAPYKFPGSR
jgi:glycosyltransferase involved in cell wall biosynthesis